MPLLSLYGRYMHVEADEQDHFCQLIKGATPKIPDVDQTVPQELTLTECTASTREGPNAMVEVIPPQLPEDKAPIVPHPHKGQNTTSASRDVPSFTLPRRYSTRWVSFREKDTWGTRPLCAASRQARDARHIDCQAR